MNDIQRYPKPIRKNISKLCNILCVDDATAYAMILMTAALMDMHPSDSKVVETILNDCNVEVRA